MEDLFRTLPALLRQFDDNDALREAAALAAWRKIAGESLARHTSALRLDGTRLTVAVAGEDWKRHLEELAGQMIFRINSILEAAVVRFIEFRVNSDAVTRNRRGSADAGPTEEEIIEAAVGELTDEMRSAAESIRDEELRIRFLLAAGSCLSRQRRMKNKEV